MGCSGNVLPKKLLTSLYIFQCVPEEITQLKILFSQNNRAAEQIVTILIQKYRYFLDF